MTFFSIGIAIFLGGCAAKQPPSPPLPRQGRPTPTEEPESTPAKPAPRALASLQLTEQGRILLESGHPDDAITILERSINLNPANGQNYYYLAEAWLTKGNPAQAGEFNSLAEIYLKEDPEWMRLVIKQRESIRKVNR